MSAQAHVSEALKCETVSMQQLQKNDFPTDCFSQDARWISNAWSIFHANQPGVDCESLKCLSVEDENGESLGVSAWFRQFHRGLLWWRMAGSGPICSDYVKLASIPGSESQVASSTAEWFANQPRKYFEAPLAIEVEGHVVNDPQWNVFSDSLEAQGWTRDTVNIESAWRVKLPETWKQYDSMLSRSPRRKARRAVKMLERNEIAFELMTSQEDIQKNWPEFVRLHQMRRIQLGQPGCFQNSSFEQFLKRAVEEFATDGSVSLAKLSCDNSSLAMILVFRTATTWFVYQSGFDTERIDLEPGHLVNALTIKAAIEAGVLNFDFLRGDEPYKSTWKCTPTTLCRTILLPPGLTSKGISSALKIKRNLQSWFNKSNKPTAVDEHSDSE
jgi:Acetyltransferase (GNAT) domain